MRNSRAENLSEHSLEVAMIAHALCTIGNVRYGHKLDADKAAVVGLFHDASEIITGDMPTPVKYYNKDIKTAYKEVEKVAEEHIIDKLPDDLKDEYRKIFFKDATKSTRTRFQFDGTFRHFGDRIHVKIQGHVIKSEQFLILLDKGVFRFQQDTLQRIPVQRVEISYYRETSAYFRNKPESLDVGGIHIAQQLPLATLMVLVLEPD